MTLSYACGTSTIPLSAETIGATLQRTAAAYPDNDALVSRHQQIRWSYADFDARVNALADGLIEAGLAKGDRVGIWSPNRAEWALVQYATAKAGLILVNINPAYRSSELQFVLRQSGCRWLFAAQAFKDSSFVEMVASVRNQLPELEQAVFFGTDAWLGVTETTAAGPPSERLTERMRALDCDDPINIQYTSGTTGFPKGATLTHHNILNNGLLLGQILDYTPADRICCSVPLYHCFGMVMCNLAATNYGSCMVYPSEAFDPAAVLETVQAERCTSLYGVPTMFIAELGHPDFGSYDLSSLRTGIMAGSPCPVEVMKRVVSEIGITEMTIAFGMTETSPVTMMVRTGDTLEHATATVGQVMSHTEVKIVDPVTGRTVPRGSPGEFLARGYPVMRGYWNDPQKTAEAIDPARWMHTGDLATMDEDGYVRIVGRAKDMIIRGGENIYPREVEEFLYTHPAIEDVQVIGVPDERYGEQLMAWIIVKPGETLSEDQVREFCRGQIAHFKVPHYIKFAAAFPMTVTGKIQKYKMRDAAVQELGLQSADAVITA